ARGGGDHRHLQPRRSVDRSARGAAAAGGFRPSLGLRVRAAAARPLAARRRRPHQRHRPVPRHHHRPDPL
ncbi:MAG: hypothetical protein AVDCRST_MAG50-1040, partial [uncultured Acidimicrobiales bacterium]